jgi:hypothetical protein
MTAIHRTWEQRIISGVFTKAQCNQWAKAVYPQIFHEPPQGHHTNLTADEARSLNELLDTVPPLLLPGRGQGRVPRQRLPAAVHAGVAHPLHRRRDGRLLQLGLADRVLPRRFLEPLVVAGTAAHVAVTPATRVAQTEPRDPSAPRLCRVFLTETRPPRTFTRSQTNRNNP